MKSSLSSGSIATKALTLFAIGGSGIRAVEPLLYLCAFGLGPRQLKIILVDPDQSNDAVHRARTAIDAYRQARASLMASASSEEGYLRTEVIDVLERGVLWSPTADDASAGSAAFAARVDRPLMTGNSADLALLFDLLFSTEMQEMDMTLGFRGVPAIGTVFMNRLRRAPFLRQLLSDAQTESDSLFFAIGSIFGGTGAAGLPVIGRTLVAGVPSAEGGLGAVRGVPAERVGAAILLPYFTLPAPPQQTADDGGIRPDSSLFAQHAAAALPTYASGEARYGALYPLGDSEPREQAINEVGGQKQANQSHYIEFFAALAALDFVSRGGESARAQKPVFRYTAVGGNNVRWEDLPLDPPSMTRLMGGLVSLQTFLTYFRPNATSNAALGRQFRGVTWQSVLGTSSSDFERNSSGLDALGQLFMGAWKWLGEMRASTPSLQLLNTRTSSPAEAQLHDALLGRHTSNGQPATTRDHFEVFRHWNVSAAKRSGKGFDAFLATMREGSEAYAIERFSQISNV